MSRSLARIPLPSGGRVEVYANQIDQRDVDLLVKVLRALCAEGPTSPSGETVAGLTAAPAPGESPPPTPGAGFVIPWRPPPPPSYAPSVSHQSDPTVGPESGRSAQIAGDSGESSQQPPSGTGSTHDLCVGPESDPSPDGGNLSAERPLEFVLLEHLSEEAPRSGHVHHPLWVWLELLDYENGRGIRTRLEGLAARVDLVVYRHACGWYGVARRGCLPSELYEEPETSGLSVPAFRLAIEGAPGRSVTQPIADWAELLGRDKVRGTHAVLRAYCRRIAASLERIGAGKGVQWRVSLPPAKPGEADGGGAEITPPGSSGGPVARSLTPPRRRRQVSARPKVARFPLEPPADPAPIRPATRAECVNGPRPCPWVGCRYNLYLSVLASGGLRIDQPGREPWEVKESCALDLAARGGMTLEECGEALSITRERARQIEESAMDKIGTSDGAWVLFQMVSG